MGGKVNPSRRSSKSAKTANWPCTVPKSATRITGESTRSSVGTLQKKTRKAKVRRENANGKRKQEKRRFVEKTQTVKENSSATLLNTFKKYVKKFPRCGTR